ncbi:dynein heavy chain, partial [Kipferlia bialata]
ENSSERTHLGVLFEKYVPRCLDALLKDFKPVTPVTDISVVETICRILDATLDPKLVPKGTPIEIIEMYFMYAAIWAVGGPLFADQLVNY